MLISTALLLDSIIRNSVCTPAKLPCRRVEVGYEEKIDNTYCSIFQPPSLLNFFYPSNSSSSSIIKKIYKTKKIPVSNLPINLLVRCESPPLSFICPFVFKTGLF
jgi:hypothetical protein